MAQKKYALFFCDTESLTNAVLFLFKTKSKSAKSSLYKLKDKYVLIFENINRRILMATNEFCFYKTDNALKIEFVKEYGKPLIMNNAVKRYGTAFSKSK